jgi:hypothetical protein
MEGTASEGNRESVIQLDTNLRCTNSITLVHGHAVIAVLGGHVELLREGVNVRFSTSEAALELSVSADARGSLTKIDDKKLHGYVKFNDRRSFSWI